MFVVIDIIRMEMKKMTNIIEFFRMFNSYVFLFAIIAVVAAAGAFVGVKVWKKKDKTE